MKVNLAQGRPAAKMSRHNERNDSNF